MVSVKVCTKDNAIISIEIIGHANFASKGEDLVCAGVSSIGVGALNALDELCADKCLMTLSDGYIKVEVKQNNKEVQMILKTLYIQLQTMVESYAEYIEITKDEV